MNSNIMSLIEQASIQSQKSMMINRHGAILFKRGNILQTSYNQYPNHAETILIQKMKKTCKEYKGVSIIVVRMNKLGKLQNSMPCSQCVKNMKNAGIQEIIWSTGDTDIFRIEKIKNLTSLHVSSGAKYSKQHIRFANSIYC